MKEKLKSGFLNGELEEEVYVAQPEGFEINGQEENVYKLEKTLYGLKQAPRACCMLYVDDIIYMGSSHSIVAEFKSNMMSRFEMQDLSLLHYFLGFEAKQEEDRVFVSQNKYASDLLKRFGLVDCKFAATPMNLNEKLQQEDCTERANARSFRSLVGGLIYLSHTRPNISYSVGVVSRFMSNPLKHHFGAAKRILHYVVGTLEYGIWYSHVSNFILLGFTESDWVGSVDDRKSTSSNIFSLRLGAITWSSKKQVTTTLSSYKAEYIPTTSVACQCIWLRRIFADL
ncbi:uncharacterized mitochondrial protein AtMg00810-like [Lycium ferocissimum]|uniref:uncharacterized mitochondrial protein AtMg00810-like n=1 Tax=Lycium ferocissimum TaxID=112874 RepID=UPI002814A3E0|nr:uncharacterized mitochondrial protein AtMg00810-like [Lycium ferocissimum]